MTEVVSVSALLLRFNVPVLFHCGERCPALSIEILRCIRIHIYILKSLSSLVTGGNYFWRCRRIRQAICQLEKMLLYGKNC